MAENERDAKPTLRPFYKEFGRGRKFGPNGIETGVENIFWGAHLAKPKDSAVSLGSLAMGNMLVENRTKLVENERNAKPTLQPFYKESGRGCKFGPNGIQRGVHKFFF